MKTADKILLFLLCISVPLCVWAWFFDLRLLLILPALPLFCLQLLVCRNAVKMGLRLIPIALVLLWAGCGGAILLLTSGWDQVLGLIMLWASISPAAGCALGWLVWFILKKQGAV